MKIRSLVLFLFSVAYLNGIGQNYNDLSGQQNNDLRTITTAVPFLMIAPDARSGALGDAGVATSPDANSMHWNPAKYAFIDKEFGVSVSFTPWLRNLNINDIYLGYLTGFYQIDERQAVAASLRYFTLGEIVFTDEVGTNVGTYKPNEWAIDGTYSRKFSEHWSGAIAGRFIYSNLTAGQYVQGAPTSAGTSIAADVAFFYTKDVNLGDVDGRFNFGVNVSNIGNKISYSETSIKKDFIPTNLRFGPALFLDLDEYNSLTFTIDVNKLLVPTPPVYARDSTGQFIIQPDGKYEIYKGLDPDVSVVQGMIQSFYDAPDGFSEEMREFNYSIGVEYWYNKLFAIRGGFFYEDRTKGNRKFFTLGAGLKYNVFGLDFAYLIPMEQQNPLANTLRFSLVFDFDAFNNQIQ
ncbi:MAG: type IX secretion system outer membrane channel protein PorV [Bacteroidales bacterium]